MCVRVCVEGGGQKMLGNQERRGRGTREERGEATMNEKCGTTVGEKVVLYAKIKHNYLPCLQSLASSSATYYLSLPFYSSSSSFVFFFPQFAQDSPLPSPRFPSSHPPCHFLWIYYADLTFLFPHFFFSFYVLPSFTPLSI